MTDDNGARLRVLVAQGAAAPPEVAMAVTAALEAEGLEVLRVDVGKIGQHASALGRVVQFILGQEEGRRLDRELSAFRPDVAVAFEPGAAAALCDARDQRGPTGAPVVAIVPELAPGRPWAVDADRFAVIDDEAGVALSDLGLDGARVIVVGPTVPRAFFEAGREPRETARGAFKLPAGEPILLVDAARLPAEVLSAVPLQLALFEKSVMVLFDAGDDADAAVLLRKAVPGLGLKAKLFGRGAESARLWRAAEVVIGRARPGAVARALAAGCAFVALEPQGAEEKEARALVERGVGQIASKALLLAAALDTWARQPAARAAAAAAAEARSADGALATAALCRDVAADKEAVLEETFAAARERDDAVRREREEEAQAARRASGPAAEIEDLSAGEVDDEVADRLAAERAAQEARARKEVEEARAEVARWEQRHKLAVARTDARLAAEAAQELDRKRARLRAALTALSRLGVAPPVEEQLADLKDKAGRTLDDELAALKQKMQTDKGGKR